MSPPTLKPLIGSSKSSLPSKSYSIRKESQYPLITKECEESIRLEGKLLLLPILSLEKSLKNNKVIHDLKCFPPSWPRCNCNHARLIRGQDLGLTMTRAFELRKVL